MQTSKFLLGIPLVGSIFGCVADPYAVNFEYYEPQTTYHTRQSVQQYTPPSQKKKRVTLFKHCDYQGNYANLKRGKYNLAKLNRYGILNDDLSSLYVPYGYQVTLYEHDNFRGRAITHTGNDRCLVNNGFNDKVSSLIISKIKHQEPYRPYNPKHVTAYQHCKYKGYRSSLQQGHYNLRQLKQLGIRNDDISSFSVPVGYQVTLYEHDNFQGRSITLQGNDKCLVNNGFNDKVSSIVVRRIPKPTHPYRPYDPNLVTAYQDCKYRGYRSSLRPGQYNLRQLQQQGIRNDDISSFSVPKGYQVTLYEHDNFQGRSITLRGSDKCLVNNGFNDKVSSLVIRKANYQWPIASKPPVTVYQHCRFDGYRARLVRGHYNLQQLRGLGIKNDDLSSIRVPYGVTVTLYEHDNFTGRSWRLNSDTNCLVSRGANDQVSSIVVE